MAMLAGVTSRGGIAASLFVAGLISGFTHCSGMCGPFVLMRVVGKAGADGQASGSMLRRAGGASLWRYHLGRSVTYSALGAIAAGAAGAALERIGFRVALVAILAGVAAVLTLAALRGAMPARSPSMISCAITRLVGRAGRLGEFPLGVALGFLPCGVLYGALAAAASTGEPLSGALAMGAFVLGTAPGLMAVGIGGAFFARRFRVARVATMPLLALNIAILTTFALRAIA